MILAVACALMLHGPVATPAPAAPAMPGTSVTAPAPWPAPAPDLVPPVRWAAIVVACLVMLAGAAWVWRRAQLQGQAAGKERIDLLASRSFGPKHRVAVIETCGERLLLALCDKEITVLTHLSSTVSDVSGAPAASETHPLPTASEDDARAAVLQKVQQRRFEVLP